MCAGVCQHEFLDKWSVSLTRDALLIMERSVANNPDENWPELPPRVRERSELDVGTGERIGFNWDTS